MSTLKSENNATSKRWASEQTRQPVTILAHNESAMKGWLLGKRFTSSERYKRTALIWGIMWLLAAVSAFIPIAHFLLVPVFVIAGPVFGYKKYQQHTISEAIEGKCPGCCQEFELPLDQQTVLPHRDVCPHCDKHIKMQVLDDET